MHRDSYRAESQPRGNYASRGHVYLTSEKVDLTDILVAGTLLRDHRVPVVGEGTTIVGALARRGQVEEALGHMNTGKGFTPETAEGCPL